MPFAYRAVCCRAARQGVEPRLTDSKSVVLSITLAGQNVENGSFSQCPSQESNLVLDLRRVACESVTLQGRVSSMFSSAGEIRTRRHWFLRPAAQPLAYRTRSATHTGFEPVISTVTGWRPLQTGPMGRVISLLQRHHRDSNSLKMFCRHLPRHTDWCRSMKVVLDGFEPSIPCL